MRRSVFFSARRMRRRMPCSRFSSLFTLCRPWPSRRSERTDRETGVRIWIAEAAAYLCDIRSRMTAML